jgi:hypothetical protein
MFFLAALSKGAAYWKDTPDELFTAWLALPDEKRNGMEAELPEIFGALPVVTNAPCRTTPAASSPGACTTAHRGVLMVKLGDWVVKRG